jgi:MoxR-like ATPase
MAGTGKTFAGQQTAEALNLNFYAMSVGVQTSKSDIIGYQDASGRYVRTHFRDAYENGGVFLMDEIDAGNANVLIQINAALSNGMCAFPDGMVIQHEDFVFIASANTFGNGANRQYVGRNQLDAATLDRFTVIEWLIDDELESNLAIGLNGKAWYMAVRAARDYVAEKNIRALISPRATLKGSTLLNSGQDIDEVILATMLGSVPEDKRGDVTEVAKKVFNKFASEVPGQLPKEVNPEVSELLR